MTAISIAEKKCSKCDRLKPLSGYSKLASAKDGLQSVCKACVNEYSRLRYEAKKEDFKEYQRRYRQDNPGKFNEYRSREGVVDRINERRRELYWADPEAAREARREWRLKNPDKWSDYVSANRDRFNESSKKYRATHLETVRARSREAYASDPEKYIAKQKRYAERHPDKLQARRKTYRAKNVETLASKIKEWRGRNAGHVKSYQARYEAARRETRKIVRRAAYAENPHPHREAAKKWRKGNPEKARILRHIRRARKRNAEGRYSLADVQRLFVLQRGKCPVCRLSLKEYHVDHIVALARGGSNHTVNLQLLHPLCNMRKTDKDPILFMQEQGFLL